VVDVDPDDLGHQLPQPSRQAALTAANVERSPAAGRDGIKGCFGDKPQMVMCSFASDDKPREGERLWCRWGRQRSSRPVLSLRQPPARLLAMIWPNIAAKAESLITSFS